MSVSQDVNSIAKQCQKTEHSRCPGRIQLLLGIAVTVETPKFVRPQTPVKHSESPSLQANTRHRVIDLTRCSSKSLQVGPDRSEQRMPLEVMDVSISRTSAVWAMTLHYRFAVVSPVETCVWRVLPQMAERSRRPRLCDYLTVFSQVCVMIWSVVCSDLVACHSGLLQWHPRPKESIRNNHDLSLSVARV